MNFVYLIATAASLCAAVEAHAVAYAGLMTIGQNTVDLKVVTDGTLGELDTFNFTYVAKISRNGRTIFAGDGQNSGRGTGSSLSTGLFATPTQLLFDTSVFRGGFFLGNSTFPAARICFANTGAFSCELSASNQFVSAPTAAIAFEEMVNGNRVLRLETMPINGQFVVANVTSVPEPASWTLLIAGFGLTGAVMRRRKLAVTA
jgi:PEP-CTERM motif